MGIFGKLFGAEQNVDVEIRDYVAAHLRTIDAMGLMGFAAPISVGWEKRRSIKDLLMDSQYQRQSGAYVFGFFDFLGQARGLSEDVIVATAKSALKIGLGISRENADRLVSYGVQASQSENGRKTMEVGAMAMADCVASNGSNLFGSKFVEVLVWG